MTPAILLLFIASATAAAQGPRPAVGAMRPFPPPPVIDDRINGMRVSLVPYGTTPTARVELVFQSGRATEQGDEIGLAQLTGDYLLEGTLTRSGNAVARELAELGTVGGGLSVSVGEYETIIAGEVLAESAPRLVEILAEVALSPAFDSAVLERLRTGVLRRNRLSGTAALAAARANQVLFPGYPADRLVSDSAFRRLTVADVRRFHQREYVGTRAHLFVAGVFDAQAVLSRARSAFAALAMGAPAAPLPAATFRSLSADTIRVVHLIDRPGASQTRIHIAYPVVDQTHPDHLVLNELNLVMGSVQTSRIIANLRERRGYSYNISTRLVRRPGATSWTIQGDVNREVTGAALREIFAEMERIGTEPPSAQELGDFQRFLIGALVRERATSSGLLDYFRFLALYGAERDYQRGFMPNIQSVTSRDIVRVHSAYLRDDRRVIVLVGDTTLIRPQLSGWTRIVPVSQ